MIQVEFDEINAAWGQAAMLLAIVEDRSLKHRYVVATPHAHRHRKVYKPHRYERLHSTPSRDTRPKETAAMQRQPKHLVSACRITKLASNGGLALSAHARLIRYVALGGIPCGADGQPLQNGAERRRAKVFQSVRT